MSYYLDFSKQAFKELEKINEPFYSNIKDAIFNLAESRYIKLTQTCTFAVYFLLHSVT